MKPGTHSTKPRLLISACLLGRAVRYNGDHKREDWIVDTLGKFVELVPVCPEVEMGLGVPREPIRLQKFGDQLELIGVKTQTRHTLQAEKTAADILQRELPRSSNSPLTSTLPLQGVILKKSSPSCGLERIKIYSDRNPMPEKTGIGFFARALTEHAPLLPKVEEGRLTDGEQRDRFLTQIFTLTKWKNITPRAVALQTFHRQHKFLWMSHSPILYRSLGQIVASLKSNGIENTWVAYEQTFLCALQKPATRKKKTNVLQHCLGYFKTTLPASERQNMLDVITRYHAGHLPFAAPAVLLQHQIGRLNIGYLADQAFFEPFPYDLTLLE